MSKVNFNIISTCAPFKFTRWPLIVNFVIDNFFFETQTFQYERAVVDGLINTYEWLRRKQM